MPWAAGKPKQLGYQKQYADMCVSVWWKNGINQNLFASLKLTVGLCLGRITRISLIFHIFASKVLCDFSLLETIWWGFLCAKTE